MAKHDASSGSGPARRPSRPARRRAAELPEAEVSRRMLQLVLDTIPVRVFWKDRDSIYLGCNRLCALDAGLAAPEAIIGLSDFELGWREQAELYRSDDSQVMASGVAKVNYEEPQTTPEGGRIWLRTSKCPLRDDAGRVIGVLGTYEDITERNRIEEALREKTDELDRFFSLTPDLLCIVGLDGRFRRLNGAWTETLGYGPAELEARNLLDLLHPDDRPAAAGALARLTGGDSVRGLVTRFCCRDGGWRWLEWAVSPSAQQQLVYGAARDITEPRRAQEALRVLVESTAGAIGTDFFGRLVRSLAEALDFRCALVAELAGPDDGSMRTLAAWLDDRVVENFEYPLPGTPCGEAVSQGVCICPRDLRRRFPDFKGFLDIPLECYFGSALANTRGKPIGVLAVMDVRPREDSALAGSLLRIFSNRAAAELERLRGEEASLNLERQLQHAQKLESLGVLAGGIAHDFNNLLMAILGNADLALLETSTAHPARPYVEDIIKASLRAAGLCQQMLAYSGRGHFRIETLDLNEMVREMTDILEVSITKKAVLRYDLSPELPKVRGDATQLRQVVMNLITNASDALGDGSGVISLVTGTRHFRGGERFGVLQGEKLTPGRYVCLDVADTGCGMDAATQARLFDPFFSTKFTGRGLGMAAVLGIIRGHHGGIRVRSEPGRGTAVTVLLPPVENDEPAAGSAEVEPPARAEPWRWRGMVLLVDDEEAVRALAERMLRRLGFEVVTAADGASAVEQFRARRREITAVVLDLTMPAMDGGETLQALRAADPGVRVLLASGYDEGDVSRRFGDGGPDAFIQKPYRLATLRAKLRHILKE
ncbi:MAG: PAS domain S-box protein [Acidobacteria bacterium]|nr:PAS domain S-box protein [Acidobacteriota bacterium]